MIFVGIDSDVIHVLDDSGEHLGWIHEDSKNIKDLVIRGETIYRISAGNYYDLPLLTTGWIKELMGFN